MASKALPIMLNLQGRTCLVVGSGEVGQRKANAILKRAGRVRLVTLEPLPAATVPECEVLLEPYASRHLEDVALAFAAATPAVNAQIVVDAKARGVLVNSASDPDTGDFTLPAVSQRGPITTTVSTDGFSPTIAKLLRSHFDRQIDSAMVEWVILLGELREKIVAEVAPVGRSNLLKELTNAQWIDRIREEGIEKIRATMQELVRQHLSDRMGD